MTTPEERYNLLLNSEIDRELVGLRLYEFTVESDELYADDDLVKAYAFSRNPKTLQKSFLKVHSYREIKNFDELTAERLENSQFIEDGKLRYANKDDVSEYLCRLEELTEQAKALIGEQDLEGQLYLF